MKNMYSLLITEKGFSELLSFRGKTYVKRYVKTDGGYEGKDQAWEYEDSIPDDLAYALEDRDPLQIMNVLEDYK